jgi:hypothetical protein
MAIGDFLIFRLRVKVGAEASMWIDPAIMKGHSAPASLLPEIHEIMVSVSSG